MNQNIIALKTQEIQKKEEKIKDLSTTNKQLEKELKTLEVQVQQNLDNLESKEKNDKFDIIITADLTKDLTKEYERIINEKKTTMDIELDTNKKKNEVMKLKKQLSIINSILTI